MGRAGHAVSRRHLVLAAAAAIARAAPGAAQSLDPERVADGIRVQASGMRFVRGPVLERLRDGASVTFLLRLTGLSRPNGASLVSREARFTLSYDLWEERFAVARAGTEPAAISHLTAREADEWCLDSLVLPTTNLAAGRFWLRLEYLVEEAPDGGEDEDESLFSLGGLIDAFSRLGSGERAAGTVESGPFQLSDFR